MTYVIKFVIKIYYKIFFKVSIIGEKNIPKESGYVLCANHISAHDPTVYAVSVKKVLYALGKKELFNSFVGKLLFSNMNVIPVDRNKLDISAMKKSLRVLKKEKSGLLIFAEGTRNHGKIPLPVTPGASMLAIKAKVPIIPLSIDSSYKLFSKVIIKISEPIDLSEYNIKEMETKDYIKINADILNDIYSNLTLHKKDKNYED